jgi:hypothetical protein
VVYGGRTLDPRVSLAAAGVSGGAGGCPTLELLPRLRGGGGDGGSTGAESRSSYLEMYAGKKKDKADPEEERLARWTTCQLSGMPLQPPCVADDLGSLFNKDAVLQVGAACRSALAGVRCPACQDPALVLAGCRRLKQKRWPRSAASKRWPALLRPL